MPHKRYFPLRNAYINLWLLGMQEMLPRKGETIQVDINWKGLFDLPAKIFFFYIPEIMPCDVHLKWIQNNRNNARSNSFHAIVSNILYTRF